MEVNVIPWNMTWSPQWHFPFSGSVAQQISPDTSWFFGAIPPQAGDGDIEQKVFETASYGKQLGQILDVLIPLAEKAGLDSKPDKEALRKLKDTYARIERVKTEHDDQTEAAAVALLSKIRTTDPQMFKRVIAKAETATSGVKQLSL
jgi:hypothetical protein